MARKSKTQPTFTDRLAGAHAQAAAAVSVFEVVATDLESAAFEKRLISADIDAEIARLTDVIHTYSNLRAEAEAFASEHLAKAGNIRALMGN